MFAVKRMYLLLTILIFAFLAYQCGGNKNENNPQPQTNQTQTENPSGTENLKAGDPAQGKQFFDQTCSACHGMDAKGLPKLGKDLTTSTFISEKSDAELLDFVKKGRAVDDPLNTTGIAMPPKGGNPALTDQQIMDIIAYVKTLHK
jgi:disulfide bond formation protein DsbB